MTLGSIESQAQTRWTTGYTKGKYIQAGRNIAGMSRDDLANIVGGQCFSVSTWRTIIEEIEVNGVEFPDTVYFHLGMAIDSVFYSRADTLVVPWASDLYTEIAIARGHISATSAQRQAITTRRKSRPVSKP